MTSNSIKVIFISIIFILSVVSCSIPPLSKDMYLQQYDTFVSRIEQEHVDFALQDWQRADALFKQYSRQYYDQYYKEMTKGERIQANLYKVEYFKYKAIYKGKSWLQGLEDLVLE